jgi:hypothetical protein
MGGAAHSGDMALQQIVGLELMPYLPTSYSCTRRCSRGNSALRRLGHTLHGITVSDFLIACFSPRAIFRANFVIPLIGQRS